MCERAVKRRYICAVWLRCLTENHYDFLHFFFNFIIYLCKRCVAHVVSVTARHGLMLRERWWKFWWCYWCLLCRSLGEGKLELVFEIGHFPTNVHTANGTRPSLEYTLQNVAVVEYSLLTMMCQLFCEIIRLVF